MRSLIAYLALVGLPLVGLIGVLRAGDGLEAPRSVGGVWELDPDLVRSAPPCYGFSNSDLPLRMQISQSGTRAAVSFNDRLETRLSVRIEGDSIVGVGSRSGGDGCPPGTLTLR